MKQEFPAVVKFFCLPFFRWDQVKRKNGGQKNGKQNFSTPQNAARNN
jgi:hypothetical protein